MPSTAPSPDLPAAASKAIIGLVNDATARAARLRRMPPTRAGVLVSLHIAGRAMTALELATAMGAPARQVGAILSVLFNRNLIERGELPPGYQPRYLYRAFEVRA